MPLKIVLVGYPGSQVIVPASKYLTAKYLPGFEITYLNYTGPIEGWTKYLVFQLLELPDKQIIFALDDYLIAAPINLDQYKIAESEIGGDVVCVKMCKSTAEEHQEYPATTQYCLWDRNYLMWLLNQVETPWEFETEGSRIFEESGKKCVHRPCLDYFCNSSLSSRWSGINLAGLKEEDIQIMRGQGLLPTGESTVRIVVFGGSGFLGVSLIQRLISMGCTNILSVSRNEGSVVALQEKFPTVSVMVGDIVDPWIVKRAMIHAEEVYLCAAQKHVNIAEVDVRSCVETNIVGTMNVIHESFISKPKTLMFISSDKAVQGNGVYGCSKKIGEKLMLEAERINPDTKYRTVRYGNILYSTGSVLCKWRDKMKKGEEVIVTDVDATRFFWSVDQAIDLIFDCIKNVKDASPFYTTMKSIRIGDLLEAMMQKYGQVPVKTIGLQPGENMHEIIADNIPDSLYSERYTKDEILELI